MKYNIYFVKYMTKNIKFLDEKIFRIKNFLK